MLLNPDDYENARQTRDPRFDGRFFVGVLTTGIYCRPVCPVRVPKKENVRLYKSAAAAAAAGFRPCLRCRPESSPGTPAWSGASWKVSRGLQLIDQGFLDENSVDELADQLGVGPRQLSRLFNDHLGASPVEVAQTRRLHFAKKLIDETDMNLSEICFASGFGSVRRFNAVFSKTYNRSPKQLRENRNTTAKQAGLIEISLSYRPPYDWSAILAFLAYRAIPGVEAVTETSYARTFRLDEKAGHFVASFDAEAHQIHLKISYPETRHLYHIIDRVRSLFDLRADSAQIDAFLSQDALLRPMVERFPGQRVPGCWSGFEVAVRAILGQQVTVKAASTLVARIAERYGRPYDCELEGLDYTFPEPAELMDADLNGMGIVGQRIAAIQAVARMVAAGELRMDCGVDTETFGEKICCIKGIGEWTAQYIAMRALNDPNAFPHSDLILRRAATAPGETLTPKQLRERAEPWQPWRAYCVILLWRYYGYLKKIEINKNI
ncbi:MAG: helix-turn-helix domain-containing protein [Pseudomonadales bacterium]|jgi:AraC family transcriptional regulator of adaptative response / DNA-3-methyladenine glycosylase II|nr:helix-turn-helix domain-containing protein [Pseudomonadales bacterium]